MIVDPVQALASATVAIAKATASVSPLPTIVPSLPEYQDATETGTRTLWYVFPTSCGYTGAAELPTQCQELV